MIFLGVDWGKIFSVPFWLEVSPGELSTKFEHFFLFVLLVSYSLYGVCLLAQKKLNAQKRFLQARFWQKVATYGLTMAVSFSFIFFFRYEAIPVLGGRFWVFIWLVMGLVWFIYLVKYYLVDLKQQLAGLATKQKLNKYLVNKK